MTHTGALAVAVLALAALVLLALPAAAHVHLVSSAPCDGQVLATPPRRVVLTFSEPVEPLRDAVAVTGPDGSRVDVGSGRGETVDALMAVLPESLLDGGYAVRYRAISADGHIVDDELSFRVDASGGTACAAPAAPADSAREPTPEPRSQPPLAAAGEVSGVAADAAETESAAVTMDAEGRGELRDGGVSLMVWTAGVAGLLGLGGAVIVRGPSREEEQ
jgi:methionine-rich copper-binding protein CopC